MTYAGAKTRWQVKGQTLRRDLGNAESGNNDVPTRQVSSNFAPLRKS
jgi:hypothetical protein